MVMDSPASRRDSDTTASLPLTAFVGRMAEREAVVQTVSEAATHSQCRAVTVVGAEGMGKSRLVSEVMGDLREQFPDLRVYRGDVRDEGGLQGAIARILRARFGLDESTNHLAQANEVCAQVMDLFGDRRVDEILQFLWSFLGVRIGRTALTEAFEEDATTFQRVAWAVLRRFFEVDAQRAPILLILEDVHRAGAEGLALLRDFTDSFRKGPVVVLSTARPELGALCHDFTALPRERHRRIDLGPLSDSESHVLARSLLAMLETPPQELIDTASRLGSGNPLLTENLVRIFFDQKVIEVNPEGLALIDLTRLARISLPLSVEESVHNRMAGLTPAEREIMERAAMMGPVFWVGGLVVLDRLMKEAPELWGGSENLAHNCRDTLKGLEARQYVRRLETSSIPGDDEYIFRNNLERERLERHVAPEDAARYHLVLAEWLEVRLPRRHADRTEEQLDLLARHYELGRRPLRAARCYLESANRARDRYANQKAVEYYEKGMQLFGKHDVGLHLDAHQHLGEVFTRLGRTDDAFKQFQAMKALAYRLDLKDKGGWAHYRIGKLYNDAGQLDECMRHLGTALALFQSVGDQAGIASCYDDIGRTWWRRGNYETSQRFLEEGLALREELGDKQAVAQSLNNIALVCQDSGRYKAAKQSLERALQLRRDANDRFGEMQALNNIGTIHQDREEHRDALECWTYALAIARELGDRRFQAVLLLNIGQGNYRIGNVDVALDILQEVEQLCVDLGDRFVLAEARRGLGKAYYLNGNISAAVQYLEKALELFKEVRSRVHVAVAQRTLAEVLRVFGPATSEGARAESLFREALQICEDLGAEIEYARTARLFADHLATSVEGTVVSEEAFAEAERLRSRADAIYARLFSDSSERPQPVDQVRVEIDPELFADDNTQLTLKEPPRTESGKIIPVTSPAPPLKFSTRPPIPSEAAASKPGKSAVPPPPPMPQSSSSSSSSVSAPRATVRKNPSSRPS
jgi:tetratricopeptide (TPR) repeat protein